MNVKGALKFALSMLWMNGKNTMIQKRDGPWIKRDVMNICLQHWVDNGVDYVSRHVQSD